MSEIALIMGVSRQRIHQIMNNYSTSYNQSKKVINLIYTKGCTICYEKAEVIHHKDKNSHNNNPENLLPLCRKCHTKIHIGSKYNTIKRFLTYICQTCGKSFKRSLGSSYNGLYCSQKCKGEYMTLRFKKKWSLNYSECVICSTTIVAHGGRGMCRNCYARQFYSKQKRLDRELID